MSDLPSNAPSPRVCHILKWSDFDGYGFNLHADKSRPGQYIGKVDENSPADVAGLKEGDRIIEVNGVNIANENHKQVVQRIKAVSNETKLLVVDSESDRWYKDHNLVVRGDQPNIIYKSSQRSSDSPESQKSSDKVKNGNAHEEDNKSLVSSSSTHSEHSTQPQLNEVLPQDSEEISVKEPLAALKIEDKETDLPEPPPVLDEQHTSEIPLDSDLSLEYDNIRFEHEEEHKMPPIPKVYVEESHSLSSRSSSRSDDVSKVDNETTGSIPESDPDPEPEQEERKSPMSTTPSPPPSLNPEAASGNKNSTTSQNSSPSQNSSGLNLNMTVAEMRAHLATKKKFDPRNDSIDLKKKYQIVQNM